MKKNIKVGIVFTIILLIITLFSYLIVYQTKTFFSIIGFCTIIFLLYILLDVSKKIVEDFF